MLHKVPLQLLLVRRSRQTHMLAYAKNTVCLDLQPQGMMCGPEVGGTRQKLLRH
jgi:hypothetical protein